MVSPNHAAEITKESQSIESPAKVQQTSIDDSTPIKPKDTETANASELISASSLTEEEDQEDDLEAVSLSPLSSRSSPNRVIG